MKKVFNEASYILTTMFIFTVGMWMMDLGASAEFASLAGYDMRGENLIFSDIKPVQIYHIGMLLAMGSFMFISFFLLYKVVV